MQHGSAAAQTITARPIVKWAGGKTQLLPDLLPKIPKDCGTYIEPFLGGGALFFALRPEKAVLADSNPELINMYQQIAADPDVVIAKLTQYENTSEMFYAVRGQRWEELPPAEAAARMLYLNRTCFNGLYRVNRQGIFNVPFGNYAHPRICAPELLYAASQALQQVTIICADFRQVLQEYAREGDFIYLDPPYLPAASAQGFTSFTKDNFSLRDHAALAREAARLSALGCTVLLTSSNHPVVREWYAPAQIELVKSKRPISRSADTRSGEDLIITIAPHTQLNPPELPEPVEKSEPKALRRRRKAQTEKSAVPTAEHQADPAPPADQIEKAGADPAINTADGSAAESLDLGAAPEALSSVPSHEEARPAAADGPEVQETDVKAAGRADPACAEDMDHAADASAAVPAKDANETEAFEVQGVEEQGTEQLAPASADPEINEAAAAAAEPSAEASDLLPQTEMQAAEKHAEPAPDPVTAGDPDLQDVKLQPRPMTFQAQRTEAGSSFELTAAPLEPLILPDAVKAQDTESLDAQANDEVQSEDLFADKKEGAAAETAAPAAAAAGGFDLFSLQPQYEHEDAYPRIKFPGSRERCVKEIWEIARTYQFETVLDPCCGSGAVAYMFKSRGKQVMCSDVLHMAAVLAQALVENSRAVLSERKAAALLQPSDLSDHFVADHFAGVFFSDADNVLIDNVRTNISALTDPHQRALAMSALMIACQRKRPQGSFVQPGFAGRNTKEMALPLSTLFLNCVAELNAAVFDNSRDNQARCLDVMKCQGMHPDLVFLDPPLQQPPVDLLKSCHFMEGLARNWQGVNFMAGDPSHRFAAEPSVFDGPGNAAALQQIFTQFKDSIIMVLVPCHADPAPQAVCDLLKKVKQDVRQIPLGLKRTKVKDYLIVGA